MTEQKLYALAIRDAGNPSTTEYTRDHLGRKITILSECVKEPVYFHDYNKKEAAFSGTVILLECSKDFLDRLKGEYFIEGVYDLSQIPNLKTARSPELQRHFENSAPPHYPMKKPKFGP